MKDFRLLTVIGFLVGCTLAVKAENSFINVNVVSASILDLTDRDTTVSKKDKEVERDSDFKEVEEEEEADIVITLTPKQEKAYKENNTPSEEELDVIEIGIITPSTRYEQPSEDTAETMIMKIDDETGEEYFVRKNSAPSEFQKLQNKRRYKRKANKLAAKGMSIRT